MIPCTTGVLATFRAKDEFGETRRFEVPVHAWDESGRPLILLNDRIGDVASYLHGTSNVAFIGLRNPTMPREI